jgi:hypothetical protein
MSAVLLLVTLTFFACVTLTIESVPTGSFTDTCPKKPDGWELCGCFNSTRALAWPYDVIPLTTFCNCCEPTTSCCRRPGVNTVRCCIDGKEFCDARWGCRPPYMTTMVTTSVESTSAATSMADSAANTLDDTAKVTTEGANTDQTTTPLSYTGATWWLWGPPWSKRLHASNSITRTDIILIQWKTLHLILISTISSCRSLVSAQFY